MASPADPIIIDQWQELARRAKERPYLLQQHSHGARDRVVACEGAAQQRALGRHCLRLSYSMN
jgi:hypothetical protein